MGRIERQGLNCPLCGASGSAKEGWHTLTHPKYKKCLPRAFWAVQCSACGETTFDPENGDAYRGWLDGENASWASVWEAFEDWEIDEPEQPKIKASGT